MYKVTAYFKNQKVTRMFKDVYDAIDYKDSADAHYPIRTTFEEGIFSMREWVYDCWNGVMDYEKNPLRHIPNLATRHMIMQVLAWMWCMTFAQLIGSWYIFGFSAIAHVILLGAIAVTVGAFETAKRAPAVFEFRKDGYHSHGRGRTYTIYRDSKGNAHKVPLPPGDPSGEHE